MKSLLGQVESKYFKIPEVGSYDRVASEYYDARLHPTCADFRVASGNFLRRVFASEKPRGRLADIGCGLSLVNELVSNNLVLIDKSQEMLSQNIRSPEKRLIDVEAENFGSLEFDWIFAILADPYNTAAAWKNIGAALKNDGECLFVVPSYHWTKVFRSRVAGERDGFARFVRSDSSIVYLPSIVLPQEMQASLITSAGLRLTSVNHVTMSDMPYVQSRKVSEYLTAHDPLIDIYRVRKPLRAEP
jgi:SAM-dependent methyltransferase